MVYLLAQGPSSTNPAAYILIAMMMLIVLLYAAFWLWMLVDCILYEPSDYRYKIVWIVGLIVFGGLAAFFYNITRRKQRIREYGR